MFYIECADGRDKPVLTVMKISETMTKTLGNVTEAPKELLAAAVKANENESCAGMYPIDAALEAWIKGQLGL